METDFLLHKVHFSIWQVTFHMVIQGPGFLPSCALPWRLVLLDDR